MFLFVGFFKEKKFWEKEILQLKLLLFQCSWVDVIYCCLFLSKQLGCLGLF